MAKAPVGVTIDVPAADIRFTEDGKLVVHPKSRNHSKARDVVTLRKVENGFVIVGGIPSSYDKSHTIPLTVTTPLSIEDSLGWNNIVGFVFD